MTTEPKKKDGKKNFKISLRLIFNLFAFAFTIYLIVYFFVSEDGMINLLTARGSVNFLWIFAGLSVYFSNVLLDTCVLFIFIRTRYGDFGFGEALKAALVGVFFSSITPSSTGGQPMQLYLLSKRNLSVGYCSACLTQKFVCYQVITMAVSVFSIIYKLDYFKTAFTSIWSALFIILGFLSQTFITSLFLILSFSEKLTSIIIGVLGKLLQSLKFIKDPKKIMSSLNEQVKLFHDGNRLLWQYPKIMAAAFLLVFLQVLAILSLPYFVYLSLDMGSLSAFSGQAQLGLFDAVCIQSFVMFTSNLVPLPGASGGAELAFSIYLTPYFKIGSVSKIKPAILLWRFVSYYSSIIISAPFSYLTKGKRVDDALKRELEAASEDSSGGG